MKNNSATCGGNTMADVEKMNGFGAGEMSGTEDMDRLFREADFSAENSGLKIGRLWQKFQEKVAKRNRDKLEKIDECELTDRELDDEELKKVAGGIKTGCPETTVP